MPTTDTTWVSGRLPTCAYADAPIERNPLWLNANAMETSAAGNTRERSTVRSRGASIRSTV